MTSDFGWCKQTVLILPIWLTKLGEHVCDTNQQINRVEYGYCKDSLITTRLTNSEYDSVSDVYFKLTWSNSVDILIHILIVSDRTQTTWFTRSFRTTQTLKRQTRVKSTVYAYLIKTCFHRKWIYSLPCEEGSKYISGKGARGSRWGSMPSLKFRI